MYKNETILNVRKPIICHVAIVYSTLLSKTRKKKEALFLHIYWTCCRTRLLALVPSVCSHERRVGDGPLIPTATACCRYPTTNGGMQNEIYIGTHCMHVFFLHVWCLLARSSRCLVAKFLRRSSAESLLRVRCWLGTATAALLLV